VVAILQDLAGLKIRIGEVASGAITLEAGARFTLTTRQVLGSSQEVSVLYARLTEDVANLRKIITGRFSSREHAILEEIIEQFLAEVGGPVRRACLAVAGPVSEGRVAATNLAWIVDRGTEAGNLALKLMARGGVWIGGGMASNIAARDHARPAHPE
jgi:glucokinase